LNSRIERVPVVKVPQFENGTKHENRRHTHQPSSRPALEKHVDGERFPTERLRDYPGSETSGRPLIALLPGRQFPGALLPFLIKVLHC
jgi:hypothetical protein